MEYAVIHLYAGGPHMQIGSIGYNYSHDDSFIMDRPMGPGTFLLLLIKTPSVVTVNGHEHYTEPVTFILFRPQTPCIYHGNCQGYTDDWIYLIMNEEDVSFLSELDIPFDVPVHIGDTEELSEIIHILAYEHYAEQEYKENIEEHYMNLFMYKLSRVLHLCTTLSISAYKERNHRMTQLRAVLINEPDKVMSVDEMAAAVNMSRSSFQHTYRRMFGTSVMTDVTKGRIDRAKRLLSSTNLNIREIAQRCGYANEYNFIRRFRKQTGQTPTEYRKCVGSK